ncbi:MAG: hypothetical protein ACTSP9_10445 [Promethearchaeota archaeon]
MNIKKKKLKMGAYGISGIVPNNKKKGYNPFKAQNIPPKIKTIKENAITIRFSLLFVTKILFGVRCINPFRRNELKSFFEISNDMDPILFLIES